MAEFSLVQIEDIFFTQGGTDAADDPPCRVEVDGLDQLALDYKGATTLSADGTPYNFVIESDGRGTPIRITPFVITTAVFDAIKAVINAKIAEKQTINLKVTGDTGTYDLECRPGWPRPIELPKTFDDGKLYDTAINLVVASRN